MASSWIDAPFVAIAPSGAADAKLSYEGIEHLFVTYYPPFSPTLQKMIDALRAAQGETE